MHCPPFEEASYDAIERGIACGLSDAPWSEYRRNKYRDEIVDQEPCDVCGKIGGDHEYIHSRYEHLTKSPNQAHYVYRPLERTLLCQDCLPKVAKYLPALLDICLTRTAVNKLKGAINEKKRRDKNHRSTQNNVSDSSETSIRWDYGNRAGKRFAQALKKYH